MAVSHESVEIGSVFWTISPAGDRSQDYEVRARPWRGKVTAINGNRYRDNIKAGHFSLYLNRFNEETGCPYPSHDCTALVYASQLYTTETEAVKAYDSWLDDKRDEVEAEKKWAQDRELQLIEGRESS